MHRPVIAALLQAWHEEPTEDASARRWPVGGIQPFIREWAKGYWEALHPYSAPGAYVNFMMDDEGQARVEATYRDNYQRLVEVKERYDPQNLFHINQNIRPGGNPADPGASSESSTEGRPWK